MTLESLITTYGYWALLIGAFLEGETIVVLAGFAAYRGYLELPWVIVCAFTGTVISDQLFFLLGHAKGQPFVAKRPTWQQRAQRVRVLLDRYQVYVVLGFRFFYGLRNITPFVIGASGFSRRRFLVLNVLGAAIWAVTVSSGGYVFGKTLERFLDDVTSYERWILGGMVAIGLTIWVMHRMGRRRLARAAAASLPAVTAAESALTTTKTAASSLSSGTANEETCILSGVASTPAATSKDRTPVAG
ncbi:MAG: DedA family protein [Planctomycetota bacterium]